MQTSNISSASSAWMLQRVLQQAGGSSAAAGQNMPSAAQNSPGGAGPPGMTGCGGPSMGSSLMSALMSVQAGQTTTADLASNLIKSFDTDGDGSLSADEINQAISQSTSGADASQAVASIDTNGDGKLSQSEIQSALDSAKAHHGGGHHHGAGGPPPSASDMAQQIMSAFDTDGGGSLSLSEMQSATSGSSNTQDITQAFNSLDKNGDGVVSGDELASAIDAQMRAAMEAYGSQQADRAQNTLSV